MRKILDGTYATPSVTDYMIDEVLSYAAARLGEEASLKLPVTLDIFHRAWPLYREHLLRLSFTDATSLIIAQTYRIETIITVDSYLASLHNNVISPK